MTDKTRQLKRSEHPFKELMRQFTAIGIALAVLAVILIVEWICR